MFLYCSSIDEASKEKFTPYYSLSLDESYQSRDLEKVFHHFPFLIVFDTVSYNIAQSFGLFLQVSQQLAKTYYDAKVQPTTLVPKQVGNMYTASLYAAFASLVHNKHSDLVTKTKQTSLLRTLLKPILTFGFDIFYLCVWTFLIYRRESGWLCSHMEVVQPQQCSHCVSARTSLLSAYQTSLL